MREITQVTHAPSNPEGNVAIDLLTIANKGSREANYAIGLMKPQQLDSSFAFAFDRVSISGGKIITVGISATIGKKDKPVRAAKNSDYHKQLEWIEQRFVVLYDGHDRRAWLIDGLSALLHLVRASIAHRRGRGQEVLFSEDDIKESDSPYTGMAAANDVLLNRANMNLKVYEKWNRLVEERSKREKQSRKRPRRRKRPGNSSQTRSGTSTSL